jgi:hypothetical protein
MNYSISSRENGKNKNTNEQSQRNGGRDDDLFGANTILNDNRRSQFDGAEEGGEDKISEFFNSKLPWDMTFAYSLTYGNNNREKQIIGNSIMISANTDLTPKWKAGISGYDFVQGSYFHTNSFRTRFIELENGFQLDTFWNKCELGILHWDKIRGIK